jgi:holo-[acyl-carrier protein] synthase
MIVAIGSDLIDVARIEGLWRRRGDAFLARILAPAERDYCRGLAQPAPSLAARFAAKEAVMKCLGTGWAQGVGFRDIEVVRSDSGAVNVALHGVAAATADRLGIRRVHLTLSHERGLALAFAVAEG